MFVVHLQRSMLVPDVVPPSLLVLGAMYVDTSSPVLLFADSCTIPRTPFSSVPLNCASVSPVHLCLSISSVSPVSLRRVRLSRLSSASLSGAFPSFNSLSNPNQ